LTYKDADTCINFNDTQFVQCFTLMLLSHCYISALAELHATPNALGDSLWRGNTFLGYGLNTGSKAKSFSDWKLCAELAVTLNCSADVRRNIFNNENYEYWQVSCEMTEKNYSD